MTDSMQSNMAFKLRGKLTTVSPTVDVSVDLERWLAIEATNASVVLKNATRTRVERMVCNFSGGVMTVLQRGLDQSETKTEVEALKFEWGYGTEWYITMLASGQLDIDNTDGVKSVSTAVDWSGDQNMLDLKVQTNLGIPEFIDDAARDAAIPTPLGDEVCINDWYFERYSSTEAQWKTAGSSTPLPNASEILAGKVKIATQTEFNNGVDETGGLYNMPKISQIKAIIQKSLTLWENLTVADNCYIGYDGEAYKYRGTAYDEQVFTDYSSWGKTIEVETWVYVDLQYDAADDELRARVGTISAVTWLMVWGASQDLDLNEIAYWDACKTEDGSFGVISRESWGWTDTLGVTFTVDSGTKTVWDRVAVNFWVIQYPHNISLTYMKDGKLYYIYEKTTSTYNMEGRVVTVTAGTMSLWTPTTVAWWGTWPEDWHPESVVVDNPSADSFTLHAVMYQDGSARFIANKIIVDTIANTSTDNVTIITNANQNVVCRIAKLDTNKSVIWYRDSGNDNIVFINNDETFGAELEVAAADTTKYPIGLIKMWNMIARPFDAGLYTFENYTGDLLRFVYNDIAYTLSSINNNASVNSNVIIINNSLLLVTGSNGTYFASDAIKRLIGISLETGLENEDKLFSMKWPVSTWQTWLVIGRNYYIGADGENSTDDTWIINWLAIKTTELMQLQVIN